MNKYKTTIVAALTLSSAAAIAQPTDMIENENLSSLTTPIIDAYAGTSVAIHGNFAVAGRPGFSGTVTGDAIVFEYDTTLNKWVYFETLTAGDGIANEAFGQSVAICDGAIIVGRPEFNYGANNGYGSAFVYLFDETNNTWGTGTKLTAASQVDSQWFGFSVDITNDGSGSYTAVVGGGEEPHDGTLAPDGASGSAHAFSYTTSGGWSSGLTFYPQTDDTDRFGYSVAVDGNHFVVGAPNTGESGGLGVQSGAVYVYHRSNGSAWSSPTILTPSTLTTNIYFGTSVALENGTLVAGADGERGNDHFATAEGKVYVFSLNGTSATLDHTLEAHDGTINDNFGTSVSISGDTIVVGASESHDSPTGNSTASIFHLDNGSWTETFLAASTDADHNDFFGDSVAISGSNVIVGAPDSSVEGFATGSIYAFKKAVCLEIDFTNDGRVNFFDVSAFLDGYNNQESFADLNGDGAWSFFDISIFLQIFNGDCS